MTCSGTTVTSSCFARAKSTDVESETRAAARVMPRDYRYVTCPAATRRTPGERV